eukprot:767751-Hanusia_phi.AAC.5
MNGPAATATASLHQGSAPKWRRLKLKVERRAHQNHHHGNHNINFKTEATINYQDPKLIEYQKEPVSGQFRGGGDPGRYKRDPKSPTLKYCLDRQIKRLVERVKMNNDSGPRDRQGK